jgi:hypothetical protein
MAATLKNILSLSRFEVSDFSSATASWTALCGRMDLSKMVE